MGLGPGRHVRQSAGLQEEPPQKALKADDTDGDSGSSPLAEGQDRRQDKANVDKRKFFFGDIYKDGRYSPLHQDLFKPGAASKLKEWLSPAFISAVDTIKSGEDPRKHLTEELAGVYSFELFTEEFCRVLLEEVDHAQKTRPELLERPNGMNRYGIVLNQIGLEPLITALQQEFILPLQAALYPEQGSCADDHHCFIVRYAAGEDVGLDMHEDDSDVTLNVCLGKVFRGATLSFCGMAAESNHRKLQYTYKHEQGRAVVHVGHHRHGADNIESGERVNFILWSTSDAYRASEAYHEHRMRRLDADAPDQICLSYTHDRDYLQYLPAPSEKDALARGVMLDRVVRRQILRTRPVHDLAQPIEEINEVPSVCLFLEGVLPDMQKRLFTEMAQLSTELSAAETTSQHGKAPKLLFFVGVRPLGGVPQVRKLCGVSGSPALAVLDIDRGCVSRFTGENLGVDEIREFVSAYLRGETPATPLSED